MSTPPSHCGLLLKNVNYIDITQRTIKRNVNIAIANERILEITKNDISLDCYTYNCSGLYLIPSYIDAHVHLTFSPFTDGLIDSDLILCNLTNAALSGVCLLRDLGSNALSSQLLMHCKNFPEVLPDILMTGEPLCVKNGHGYSFGVEIAKYALNDWITKKRENGFEWIKVMNGPELHDINYLSDIVSAAHLNNIKVACHAFTPDGIASAIESGMDTIEHAVPYSENLSERSRGQYFTPTAYSAWKSLNSIYTKIASGKELSFIIDWYELIRNNFKYLTGENCMILAGTDGGSFPSSISDIKEEVKFFMYAGMDFFDALSTATIFPARCFDRQSNYGSIETDKFANMIFLKGNPCEDFQALDYPIAIMLKGKFLRNEIENPWN
jgi:imidazolonepropionase-like amidohydrolase